MAAVHQTYRFWLAPYLERSSSALDAKAMDAFGRRQCSDRRPNRHVFAPGISDLHIRQAAHVQFMHAMVTFTCAKFMNTKASGTKYGPAAFLAGSLLYAPPVYVLGQNTSAIVEGVRFLGTILLVGGWFVLISAGSAIDQVTVHPTIRQYVDSEAD